MRKRTLGVLALVLVLGLVGAACGNSGGESGGGGSSESDGGGTMTVNGQQITNKGEQDVSGESSVEVEADNEGTTEFYFKPSVLKGTAGQQITVEVKNEGDLPHTFTIDDQNIDEMLQSGDSADVKVTLPDSGASVFYCKIHQANGMAGALQVA